MNTHPVADRWVFVSIHYGAEFARPIQAVDRGNTGRLRAAADHKETVCAAWIKRREYIPSSNF